MSSPQTLWDASEQLRFDEPLEPDDLLLVNTEQARGDFKFGGLLRRLGVDPVDYSLQVERSNLYALFCSHRGSGKSTELRSLRGKLDRPEPFCVIFIAAVRQLDFNNLQYTDVLFALAQTSLERLEREAVDIDAVFLGRLDSWFKDRVESHAATQDFATEIKAGVNMEAGVPFFGKLFAAITNTLKVNSSYKTEFRRILKNSFAEFAAGFNA